MKSTTCAMCGNQFIMHPGHIYKVRFAGKEHPCCSYPCYQTAKKVKEDNKESEYVKHRKSMKVNK